MDGSSSAISELYYNTDGKLICGNRNSRRINQLKKTDRYYLRDKIYNESFTSLDYYYRCAANQRPRTTNISVSNVEKMIEMINVRSLYVNQRILSSRSVRKSKERQNTYVTVSNQNNEHRISQDNVTKEEMYGEAESNGEKKYNVGNYTEEYSMYYSQKILTPVEKVIRAIKTVNLLLKAITTNIKNSGNYYQLNKEQSKKHQEMYLTSTNNEEKSEEKEEITNTRDVLDLNFSVSDYKINKEKTVGVEEVAIMKMHKSLRTDEQIHNVVIGLTTVVEEFNEYPKKMQYALVRHGWYEKHQPKRVIIRQGHAAQNFYFIISGLAQVKIASKGSIDESCGETVAFLRKGQSFGELALMHGGKRNASIVTLDQVELLSVTREDFVEIFMGKDSEKVPQHIVMLYSLPILEGWPLDCLPYDDPKICHFTYIRKGTVICRDSNNCEWIYIINSGTCRLVKDLSETDHKNFVLRPSYFELLGHSRTTNNNKDKSKKVYILLKILQRGDILGMEAVAFEDIGATDSVMCISDGAECVAIQKSFFVKKVTQAYMRKLRVEVRPFPRKENLVAKLQTYEDWQNFKHAVLYDAAERCKEF